MSSQILTVVIGPIGASGFNQIGGHDFQPGVLRSLL